MSDKQRVRVAFEALRHAGSQPGFGIPHYRLASRCGFVRRSLFPSACFAPRAIA
jgi:hypothetical protein